MLRITNKNRAARREVAKFDYIKGGSETIFIFAAAYIPNSMSDKICIVAQIIVTIVERSSFVHNNTFLLENASCCPVR